MLKISDQVSLGDDEFEISAIRAQGAGGQNVNKVSSAIHLRFDIETSSLPDSVKRRLLATSDQRITAMEWSSSRPRITAPRKKTVARPSLDSPI